MVTKDENYMLPREEIYAMLTKEDAYAQSWGKGKESRNLVFPPHAVSRRTSLPFTEMEWIGFAEQYLAEAKAAHANYCPDNRAIILRMIKAASLLVTALQVHAAKEDIEVAGTSCNNFPIKYGGLQRFLHEEKLNQLCQEFRAPASGQSLGAAVAEELKARNDNPPDQKA